MAAVAGAEQQFDIARVISRAVEVSRRNFTVFAGLALVLAGLPALLTGIIWTPSPASVFSSGFGTSVFMNGVVSFIASTLLEASIIHGVVSDLNGRRESFGECLGTAFRHVLPLIGIAIVTAIAISVGLILFIVPGVIVGLMLCVAAPARVVEGHGVMQSLTRSAELTRNHRWSLLGLFVLLFVMLVALEIVVSIPFTIIAFLSRDLMMTTTRLVVTPLVSTAASLIGATLVASIYFELRTIKEGATAELLARAFE